ncbi:MAG TPA: RNA polymerase sigma factor [Tahibacter sp.]|uniref:RNA polymerase sigma factor n=1 Tax=Tahibacter sp. TaxID=2056211 RepID=UPI002C395253|nr:RNA polymerase sigma factor [Tahibacter sp.]HSX60429.1 RNA polymerase sigma factor [Tahibacter sp.]
MTSSALADLDRDFLAARNGDRAAFGRLVAATQRMVASIALAVSADVHESEDIAQDVFVLAWQRLRDMRGPASLLPWLRHVTRHRAIDRIRAARYRERTQVEWGDRAADVADDAAGVTERLSAEQDAALLARAIDEITADSREVLLLYYREGESGRRVATLLGISEAAVRKRLQRARESLRSETHRLLGDAAQRTAPGPAFTLLVGAALLQPTAPSAAAGSAGGGVGALAAAWKWLAGPFGGLALSIGLVVAAVWWEMRGHVSRLVDARDRRAMRDNGVVYAALMATYMVLLWHASRALWSRTALLLAAAGFSAAIIALAWRRARLLANRAVRNQAGGPRDDT